MVGQLENLGASVGRPGTGTQHVCKPSLVQDQDQTDREALMMLPLASREGAADGQTPQKAPGTAFPAFDLRQPKTTGKLCGCQVANRTEAVFNPVRGRASKSSQVSFLPPASFPTAPTLTEPRLDTQPQVVHITPCPSRNV